MWFFTERSVVFFPRPVKRIDLPFVLSYCVYVCYSHRFVVCIPIFPLSKIENRNSLLFSGCVMFLWLSHEIDCCSYPETVACCGFPPRCLLLRMQSSFGCHWVVLATLGPRTTLNHLVWPELCSNFRLGCHPIIFVFFTELWTVCFTAICSGWSSYCLE